MKTDDPTARKTATPRTGTRRELLTLLILLLLLAGLPLAVWIDLRNLSSVILQRQASDLNSIVTSFRDFYGSDVVGRVLASHGAPTQVLHDYEQVPGAIPLPASLSLALGQVIASKQSNVSYRFFSDYPFKHRAPHAFDAFEKESLAALRTGATDRLLDIDTSGLNSRLRMVTPVIMGTSCVNCHNSHPESTKTDWKVGDVRGIQEISVSQPIALNLWSFKYILAYFLSVGAAGLTFLYFQHRQNGTIQRINGDLQESNEFLASISMKISHYLSPQIYRNIFSGELDVEIKTQRKKLTIFFSDIKDFTTLTEKLQPEEITALVNEYFTEMSAIALRHGGTIDKFIGDAILVFFGDPDSRGAAEDAKACVRMAIEMQNRLAQLNVLWRKRGLLEDPFRIRMGINTGFCNVGNFGSLERMDYTILGAEANLAARLQAIAQAGRIVVSYETYALVRDMVAGHALEPTSMKGLSRQVVPYQIDGVLDEAGVTIKVFSEHSTGLDLHIDLGRIDAGTSLHVRAVLEDALRELEKKPAGN